MVCSCIVVVLAVAAAARGCYFCGSVGGIVVHVVAFFFMSGHCCFVVAVARCFVVAVALLLFLLPRHSCYCVVLYTDTINISFRGNISHHVF